MRTRLIAIVAVLAAALLGPAAAFAAVDAPVLAQPTSPTATAPVTLQWTDVAVADGYRVFRANADCTTGITNISDLAAGDIAPGVQAFNDSSPLTGTHCYFLRAFVGLEESADSNGFDVTYDTDFPTGSVTSPVNGAVLNTSSPITVTSNNAADATSGVQSVQFFSSPTGLATWTSIGTAVSGPPYSASWSPSDGTYDLKATIKDNVGHTFDTTSVLGVLVDGTAPVAPAAPTGVSPVNAAPSILFTGSTDPGVNASGVDHYDVLRDGAQVNASPIIGAGPFTWTDIAGQSSDPAAGSHGYSYTVVAVDAAGNQSAASGALQIVMDTFAPDAPAAPTGASPVKSAPSILFTATSDPLAGGVSSGVGHYDVYRDGSKVNKTAIPAAGPLTWTDNASQSSNPVSGSGSYAYTVVAIDLAGNASATSPGRTIALDADAPNTPAAPTGASPVGSAPSISFTATNDPTVGGVSTGVDHYDVYRDGAQMNASPIPAGGPLTWSDVAGQSTTPASGTHSYSYRVVAVDTVGNASSQSPARVIDLDTTPPITPAVPSGATPVHLAPSISFTATTDPTVNGVSSGINHYDVYRDNVKVNKTALVGAGPFTWTDDASQSLNPPSASNLYSYTVLAVDNVGNQTFSANRVIMLDVDAPTVTIGGVASGDSVSGALALSATAGDTGGSGVASVQYGYAPNGSGGPYTAIGASVATPPFARSFATTGVADGRYEIRALASDAAGNTTPSLVTNVLVDNTDPITPAKPVGAVTVVAAPTITVVPTTDPGGALASGIDHYDVYRDGAKVNISAIPAAGPYTWSDTTGSSSSPAVTSGTYTYTVVAVDVAGNASGNSPGLSIVLDPQSLSAPTSVSATATPTSQRPQVSWVAPAATPGFTLDHYRVLRNGVFLQSVPGTSFTDNTPSLADSTYTYQVVATDLADSAFGAASAPVSVVYDTTAPAAPAGVSANAAVDGSVSIGWAASGDGAGSGVARYVVRRSLSSTPPPTAADGDATCQVTATSCSDATTLTGKLYSYAVFAIDRAGNTSLAGNSAAVTARDQLPPAKPTGLGATPGNGAVDLHWAAAGADDDVAGYVLVAKPGSGAPASETDGTRVCAAIVAGSTACTATGLTNGATYTFGLFALDEALNRSQPATVSAAPNGKVIDTKAPAAVTQLKAKVAGRKVTLTWKNPADRDFDHVEITAGDRKPAALKASKRVYSGRGTKATITLAPGQSRWFVVVAYDAVGNASSPASVHVTIAPVSKFGPATGAKVHGKVRLTWPLRKGARYYNVQVFVGKKRVFVGWPGHGALQLPKGKLKRGKKYTWYVWPGIGAKAKAHYGKLIGRNAFTFTG